LDHKPLTNVLLAVYGAMAALVLGLLVGQFTFGSISFWGLMIACISTLMSFLAGAGAKGSLLVGTIPQMLAGSLLGVFVIAGCLWVVHSLAIVLVVTNHLNLPGEFWIGASALTGFLGATKWDARRTEGAPEKDIVKCPNCPQKLRLDLGKSGTVSCPSCKHRFGCCTVHLRDVKRDGVIKRHWIIGAEVDRAAYETLKDSKGHLYASIHYEDGQPRMMILKRQIWDALPE
jgi:hypothetical protein